jgi:outer membrane protein OmpA-like peptidoglycan-associated protein
MNTTSKLRICVMTGLMSSSVLLLSACSSTPENEQLNAAHASYDTLKANSNSGTLATVELKDADDALKKADAALEKDANDEATDHKIYLASQRVAIAEQAYNRKLAEQTLAQTNDQRDKLLLAARTAEADRAKAALKDLQAKQTDRGIVMTLGDVLFDTGKSNLKPGGSRVVNKLASYLQENPERKVAVEGFTDSVGGEGYNQELSERRAESVKAALVRSGTDPNRVAIQGYGEEFPVAGNESSSGRQLNRRVEIVLSDENGNVAPR